MSSDYWSERQTAVRLLWVAGIVLLNIPSVISRVLGAAVLLVIVVPWVSPAIDTVREWDRVTDQQRLERRRDEEERRFDDEPTRP